MFPLSIVERGQFLILSEKQELNSARDEEGVSSKCEVQDPFRVCPSTGYRLLLHWTSVNSGGPHIHENGLYEANSTIGSVQDGMYYYYIYVLGKAHM